MAIIYEESGRVFTLQTSTSSYQMKAGEHDVLLHLYYGEKIEPYDMSYLIMRADRGFSGNLYEARKDRTFSLDYLPQEYSCFGNGDYRADCLRAVNADGSQCADLRYKGYKIYKGKYSLPGLPALHEGDGGWETLEIALEDSASGLEVTLYYGVLESLDVIARAARIVNHGQKPVRLERVLSFCLDMPDSSMDFMHFYGKHTMERMPERLPLHHGSQSVGSRRGTSSHHHNPFVILCRPEACEEQGECFGFSLLYSGSFTAAAEVDQIHQTRLVMGIGPDGFSWNLEPGEAFYTPEAALVRSGEGLSGLSLRLHDLYREYLIRGKYKTNYRPVLINNWEATYFDFTGEKLLDIAGEAARLGIEMLVLDDGWFGKRDTDSSGLGDWAVNEKKLGMSLKELADRVNGLGLKFGLWVEPEMISEDSDLYRAHPDWALRMPGRPGNIAREQFVLDFSREEVRSHIEAALCRILDGANIEYIKWDMNRSIANVYSAALPAERQGEVLHRYVLGLYEMLEHLTARYPDILFEGCSGGGGRFDAGMLYYTPQIWCSDDTDAIERLKIQYGTSFGYPVSAVGSHVSACPNHQTFRTTPFDTRATVAMAGSFGYELDVNRLEETEKEAVRAQVREYKEYYRLVHDGDYYRLTSPFGGSRTVAWEFVSKDRSEALVCGVVTALEANPSPIVVKLRGLDAGKKYAVNGTVYPGSALMAGGILLPVPQEEYWSYRYPVREVKEERDDV